MKRPFDTLKAEVLEHLRARNVWTPVHRLSFVMYASREDINAALAALEREGLAISDAGKWRAVTPADVKASLILLLDHCEREGILG